MIVRGILHKITASSFRRFQNGYLLRTSHPWLLGTGPSYIVTEAQKEELMAVIPPRHPFLVITLIGALSLALGSGAYLLVSTIFVPMTIDPYISGMGAGLVYYLGLVVMIRQRLRRMAPILAEAVPLTPKASSD